MSIDETRRRGLAWVWDYWSAGKKKLNATKLDKVWQVIDSSDSKSAAGSGLRG